MKKQIIVILALMYVSTTLFGQFWKKEEVDVDFPIDSITHKVTYEEIVEADTSSDRLMERAVVWIEHFYKNPHGVIEEKDHEKDFIALEHQFYVWNLDRKDQKESRGPRILYDMNIYAMDGEYRYKITKIRRSSRSYFGIEEWINNPDEYDFAQEYLPQINDFFLDLIKDLKKWMKPYVEETQEGW
jgi:hypothetical protein